VIVAPITADAARYAVENWHYSATMPVGRSIYFGVREGDELDPAGVPGTHRGVVIFGRGASPYLGRQFGVNVMQVCELTRVALHSHVAPVSQIVSEAVRQLRSLSPGLRVIVSFADPYHDHHGGIYQAMNWLYLGETAATPMWVAPDGGRHHLRTVASEGMDTARRGGKLLKARRLVHNRMVSRSGTVKQFGKTTQTFKIDDCEQITVPGKHRYALPLDRAMRKRLLPLVEPYPKRVESSTSRGESVQDDTPAQPGG
jgi:hypothetical protein